MKKILILVLFITIGLYAQAQIVRSTTARVVHMMDDVEKMQYIKGGMSVGSINAADYSDFVDGSESVGYMLAYGVDKPFWQSSTAPLSAFWGYEVGLGSRGLDDCLKHNIRVAPKVGAKCHLRGWAISYYCGLYASIDYAQGEDSEEYDYYYGYNNFDVGFQLGLDYIFNKFLVGISLNTGFISMFSGDGAVSESPYVESVFGDFFEKATTMNTNIYLGIIF